MFYLCLPHTTTYPNIINTNMLLYARIYIVRSCREIYSKQYFKIS